MSDENYDSDDRENETDNPDIDNEQETSIEHTTEKSETDGKSSEPNLEPGTGKTDNPFESTYTLKRDAEYTSNNYEYRTDSQGRITHASGQLRLEEGHRYGNHQLKAGGASRLETDEGGHLIATRFGGSGKVDNLVAMDEKVNHGQYKTLENGWERELKKDPPNEVYVEIRPIYRGQSERPDRFIVTTTVKEPNGNEKTYVTPIKNR